MNDSRWVLLVVDAEREAQLAITEIVRDINPNVVVRFMTLGGAGRAVRSKSRIAAGGIAIINAHMLDEKLYSLATADMASEGIPYILVIDDPDKAGIGFTQDALKDDAHIITLSNWNCVADGWRAVIASLKKG